MKKKRTISLKHPKLQQIRNNLRILFIMATNTQWFHLHNEIDEIEYDQNGELIFFDDLAEEQKERIIELEKGKTELHNLVERSICKCRRCVKTDQDMTYNPNDKSWYCVECYTEMYNSDQRILYLEHKLTLSEEQIREFVYRLASPEGCQYNGIKWRCGGKNHEYSRQILNRMKVSKKNKEVLLELCKELGGYCDCEILMNVASYLLGEETPW